jgi:hypothetical protein|tara:strand:+ start:454 stop:900 length:447 start_codon:yes stop_codon:yes gene_type:complete
MNYKVIGQKFLAGAKKLGQKIKKGGKWIGNKIYDHRKEILLSIGAIALSALGHKVAPDIKEGYEKIKQIREGLAEIPMENVAERQGYKEQFRDVIKAPLTDIAERVARGTGNLLFREVPKRHSAELQILARAGLDAMGRPKRPEPSWD